MSHLSLRCAGHEAPYRQRGQKRQARAAIWPAWAIVAPRLILAFLAGWKGGGVIDDGETRALRARRAAMAERLRLAYERERGLAAAMAALTNTPPAAAPGRNAHRNWLPLLRLDRIANDRKKKPRRSRQGAQRSRMRACALIGDAPLGRLEAHHRTGCHGR